MIQKDSPYFKPEMYFDFCISIHLLFQAYVCTAPCHIQAKKKKKRLVWSHPFHLVCILLGEKEYTYRDGDKKKNLCATCLSVSCPPPSNQLIFSLNPMIEPEGPEAKVGSKLNQ